MFKFQTVSAHLDEIRFVWCDYVHVYFNLFIFFLAVLKRSRNAKLFKRKHIKMQEFLFDFIFFFKFVDGTLNGRWI